MSNAFNLFGRGLVFTYTIAHMFVVVSFVAFGLRADGWVLHPLAVAWYAAFCCWQSLLAGSSLAR